MIEQTPCSLLDIFSAHLNEFEPGMTDQQKIETMLVNSMCGIHAVLTVNLMDERTGYSIDDVVTTLRNVSNRLRVIDLLLHGANRADRRWRRA